MAYTFKDYVKSLSPKSFASMFGNYKHLPRRYGNNLLDPRFNSVLEREQAVLKSINYERTPVSREQEIRALIKKNKFKAGPTQIDRLVLDLHLQWNKKVAPEP